MKNEKAEKLFQIIGEIDEGIVVEAEDVKATNVVQFQPKKQFKKLGILVASITFVTISVIGISGLFNMGSDSDSASSEMVADAPAVEEADSVNVDDDADDELFEREGQLEYPPDMNLRYITNGNINELTIPPGLLSWTFQYTDGTGYDVDADRIHLLEYSLEQIPTIIKDDDFIELMISFDTPPDAFIVRRWSVLHMGSAEEYWNDFEEIYTFDGNNEMLGFTNFMTIPNLESGWIYQIIAHWPQGSADFIFHITD